MNVGYGFKPIAETFRLSLRMYDMLMETKEKEMIAANVVEISDEGSSDDEAVVENEAEDEGDDA